jgi:membrane-bound lytic murein transglycosylase D
MKKINLFTAFLLISSISCGHVSHIKDKEKLEAVVNKEALSDEDLLEQMPNDEEKNTHELVEADADDTEIKIEVGSNEIDEELPEESQIELPPTEKKFLIKKNTGRMKFWVNYFIKKDRERFQRFINNGEEYRHHIEEIFKRYDLPKELYYVGLIESGYYLGARSRASAVGPWQFIKGTGKRYGLKINREIDERRDLFKATHAAAQYLKDLNNVFLSWELALSAYNAGEYGILRRIMKYKTRDYYELSRKKRLPSETINYVPKVLAAMHIISNAEKYGFTIPVKNQRIFDKTELRAVRKNMSLSRLARKMKISTKLLKKLNPELKRGKTPRYYSGYYKLRIPSGMGAALEVPKPESRKEIIRRTASKTRYHKVKRGETLLRIAKRYGTSAGKLARLNNFKTWRTSLRIGQRLKVSGRPVRRARVVQNPIIYKVRPGDNLTTLAKLFKTRVSKIKRANNLRRNRIYVGQKIVLPNTKRGVYTVKKGDHLTKIARKFNLPMGAIIKLNALRKKTIFPGQKLIVDID